MKKIKTHSSLVGPRRQLCSSSFLVQISRGIPQEDFFQKLSIYLGHKFQRNRHFM